MYYFYLGETLLPVPPSKMQISINGKNDTITLINDGDVNILKRAGLTTVEFDVAIPNTRYPYAVYDNGFQRAEYYLNRIENLMQSQKPFQFIVTRQLPDRTSLFGTNLKVAIESYTIKEEAKNGFDTVVSIKLKQYRDYGTKTVVLANNKATGAKSARDISKSPYPSSTQSYTVKSGDSLWKIAKQYYGDGSKYTKIYDANKDKIKNPSLIYPGQVLSIPA